MIAKNLLVIFFSLGLLAIHTSGYAQQKDTVTVHTVKDGETLFSISQMYNVRVANLKEWNELQSNMIYVGDEIRIQKSDIPKPQGPTGQETSQSNTNRKLDALIARLDSAATAHVSKTYKYPSESSLSNLEKLFSLGADTADPFKEQLEVLEAQKNVLKGDVGLDLGAGFLENFDTGFFDVEGFFYRRQAQVGIQWNILKDGLVENQLKLKEIKEQKQVLSTWVDRQLPWYQYRKIQDRIDYIFNGQKMEILERSLDLLSRQEKIDVALFQQNYRMRDDVLAITSEKILVNQQLQSTRKMSNRLLSNGLAKMEILNLPILDVKLNELLAAANEQGKLKTLYNLETIPEHKGITDVSLSTSVQYNFFSNILEGTVPALAGQREFLSVGVNLSIPFPLQTTEKNDLIEAKTRKKEAESLKEMRARREEVYAFYNDYQQLLSEYKRAFVRYGQYSEKVRWLLVKKKTDDPEYSPRELLSVLSSRYELARVLIDKNRKMYEKLLEMYSIIPHRSVQQYVKFIGMKDLEEDISPAQFNHYLETVRN